MPSHPDRRMSMLLPIHVGPRIIAQKTALREPARTRTHMFSIRLGLPASFDYSGCGSIRSDGKFALYKRRAANPLRLISLAIPTSSTTSGAGQPCDADARSSWQMITKLRSLIPDTPRPSNSDHTSRSMIDASFGKTAFTTVELTNRFDTPTLRQGRTCRLLLAAHTPPSGCSALRAFIATRPTI